VTAEAELKPVHPMPVGEKPKDQDPVPLLAAWHGQLGLD
jgi:hypothetical protein